MKCMLKTQKNITYDMNLLLLLNPPPNAPLSFFTYLLSSLSLSINLFSSLPLKSHLSVTTCPSINLSLYTGKVIATKRLVFQLGRLMRFTFSCVFFYSLFYLFIGFIRFRFCSLEQGDNNLLIVI